MKRMDEYELEWQHELQRRRERDAEHEPAFVTARKHSRPRYSRFRTLAHLYEQMSRADTERQHDGMPDAQAA